MSPMRLLILAILLYIVYRLLFGGKQKKKPVSYKRENSYVEMPVNDMLVEDPVCKKLIPSQQAIKHRLADQTMYFCSEECCRIFISQQGEN